MGSHGNTKRAGRGACIRVTIAAEGAALHAGFTSYATYFQYDKKGKRRSWTIIFATYAMPDIFQKVPN